MTKGCSAGRANSQLRLGLAAVLALTLAGCSTRAFYDGVQASERNECMSVPPSQYDTCLEQVSQRWEDYERDRAMLREAVDEDGRQGL